LSPDSFVVLKDLPSIPPALALIRDKIIHGTFQVTESTMISMSKAHELAYGGMCNNVENTEDTIAWGRSKCHCKNKCNSKHCHCLKNGMKCGSGCGCGGSCCPD
jgi:hypothetical protein